MTENSEIEQYEIKEDSYSTTLTQGDLQHFFSQYEFGKRKDEFGSVNLKSAVSLKSKHGRSLISQYDEICEKDAQTLVSGENSPQILGGYLADSSKSAESMIHSSRQPVPAYLDDDHDLPAKNMLIDTNFQHKRSKDREEGKSIALRARNIKVPNHLEPVDSLYFSPRNNIPHLYPTELRDAVNSGDIERIQFLTDHFIDKKCVVRIRNPAFSYERNGHEFIPRFHTTFLKAQPDVIMTMNNLRATSGRGCMIVECLYKCEGTRVFQNVMNEFHGVEGMPITKLMRRSKYSKQQWRILCAKQENAMKNDIDIIVSIRARQVLVVDEKTGKIKTMFIKSYLSSFKAGSERLGSSVPKSDRIRDD